MSYEKTKAWRKMYPERRAKQVKRRYAKTQGARNTGRHWTSDEINLLFDFKGTDRELAEKLGRSEQAIHVQRKKHKCPECQQPVRRSDPAWIDAYTRQVHHDPCPEVPHG